MKISELKYLSAYILPICAFIGIWKLDVFSFLTPVVTFILIPIIEYFSVENKRNLTEGEELSKTNKLFFDVLLLFLGF